MRNIRDPGHWPPEAIPVDPSETNIHLTVVFAALGVARHLQHQTGTTIKRIVQTLQPLRTVVVTVGDREILAERTIDDTARDLIHAINAGH